MKQVIQYQKTGEMEVAELPAPVLKPGGILVHHQFSLISAGTERTSVETAQASMVGKAKSRPDLVKQVLDNVKREGLGATYEKVQNRLDNYKELGYSAAGIVLESSCDKFKPGDRVACAGAGYASHAEVGFTPQNLAVKIPDSVAFEDAAFTTLGAIALQGVRQADVRLGESVAVVGLGLLGLITVQLLKANGCRVIGLDISDDNFSIAKELGCDDCILSGGEAASQVESFTRGHGTDAVILTASTKSNQPLEMALQFARKRSKIVIVGVVGMELPRSPFYEKEIDLRISCSYGPGRYDADYEEKGVDYPVGYVRWTENRNMEAVLDLVEQKKLNFKALVSHTIPVQNALTAYEMITGKRKEKFLGVLLQYPEQLKFHNGLYQNGASTISQNGFHATEKVKIGFVGAGNFAQSYLLPNLPKETVQLQGIAASRPVNAKAVANKFGFSFGATEAQEVIAAEDLDAVFIATRHDSHARFVIDALNAGKHVFVEKPLAVTPEELQAVREAWEKVSEKKRVALAVGFNRRFSQPFQDIKRFFMNWQEPMVINYRVNAGFIPKTHWTQDAAQGGRMIGEGCHFIDTMQFLTGAHPVRVFAESIDSRNTAVETKDNINVSIKFSDGSIGNLLYIANGTPSLEKEYCEVSCGGKTAIMQNFNRVDFYAGRKASKKKYDCGKGHREEVEHFFNVCQGRETPELTFESIYLTTLATFKVLESLLKGTVVNIHNFSSGCQND